MTSTVVPYPLTVYAGVRSRTLTMYFTINYKTIHVGNISREKNRGGGGAREARGATPTRSRAFGIAGLWAM